MKRRATVRVKCCDKLTGRTLKVYDSVEAAANAAGVTPSVMREYTRKGPRPCGSTSWLVWRREESDEPIVYAKLRKPVIAFDGETYIAFLSTQEAAIAMDSSLSTLKQNIAEKKPFEFNGRMVRACQPSQSHPAFAAIRKYRRRKDCFDE